MKFGFYSPYLNTFGGGERYMLTLASYLSKNHDVDIFWDEIEVKAPLSRFLKIDLSKIKFVPDIFKYSTSQRIKSSFKYDSIFVLSDGSIPTLRPKKNVLHFQVPFKFPSVDFKTKLKLKSFKYVVCNSKFTKEFIDQSFKINSTVIYPPVDIESIKQTDKEKLIMSVGRFSKDQLHPKKQEVLIEVFKEIYKKAPKWKLLMAGQAKKEDEKYLRELKKSVRGFGIKIAENMPVDQLRKSYAKCSIYWHATGFGEDEQKNPERMEHFGISTVEAQAAAAVPVVVGKGGQKEIVEDGINGLLWTTKAQLFDLTLDLIKNPQKMQKLSQAAVKNSKRFSEENFYQEYDKIIFAK
ncbi:MAG TPA: glycosyltransferase [Candidatus Saccharimonadales bacterium]|nr:glycosyltransferase [Candidatus Saccharimonadales bacterium]